LSGQAHPTVSLCIPTIGRTDYLAQLLRSVERQTFTETEILILDNASPRDVVGDYLNPFLRQNRNAIHLRVESRIPMFANFNRGIAAARGRYVVFFHDDDDYAPTLIERSVALLEANTEAGFAGTNYDLIDEHDSVTERRRWIRATRVVAGRHYIEDLVSRGRNIVPMPGIVFRRGAIARGFDESLPIHFGDFVLLMRIAEERAVALIADPLIRVRRHAAQASQGVPFSRGIALRTRVLLSYLDEYEGRHPGERAFVERLRKRAAIVHRTGLAWGWVVATDSSEARACVNAFGSSVFDAPAKVLLGALDHAGVRRIVGSRRMQETLRRLARRLRM